MISVIKSSSVCLCLPDFFLLRFLLLWEAFSCLLSVTLFPACREELSTGLTLSLHALDVDYTEGCKQAREREGERAREGERGRCVAASLQHLSPDSHSQSTHSTAISSSTNTGLTASVTALKGPAHLKISQQTEPEWRRRERVIQLHGFTVRKTEDLL